MELLGTLTILTAALMVGNELTLALFVDPTITRQSNHAHAVTARAFAQLFGRIMPFWYGAVLLLSVVEMWIYWQADGAGRRLFIASSALWLASIVFTLFFPLPINNRIVKWQLDQLPKDCKHLRREWEHWHRLRVLIIMAALVCLTLAVLKTQAA